MAQEKHTNDVFFIIISSINKKNIKMNNLLKLSALLFILTVTCSSCEKDDDNVNAPDSLTGTAWLYETDETVTTQNGVEVAVAVELDFVSATKVDINILVGGVKGDIYAISGFTAGRFDYTYSKPNVTIIDEEGEKLTGSVNGNKMTIDGDVLVKEED
jgi:hypothetical protein